MDLWDTKQTAESKVRFINNLNQIDSTQNLSSNNKHNYNYFSVSPYYDFNLDTLGKKLKLNYNCLVREYSDYSSFISQNYIGYFNRFHAKSSATNNAKLNYSVNTLNLDIELPFKNFKTETGGKYSYFRNNSDIVFYNTSDGSFNLDKNQSNQFIYNEHICAVYFSIEKQWNDNFFAKAGLRYETTKTKGNSVTRDTTFINNFDDFFPSIFMSYNPDEYNSFSLGYNKRTDRPVFYDINPI